MKTLFITPPLVQLNTPYPATQSLTAFVEEQGHRAVQWDLAIDLIAKVYTREFLTPLFEEAYQRDTLSEKAKAVAINKSAYLNCVESVVRFLQGKDDTLATRISSREFLPEAGRCRTLDEDVLEWAFGSTGSHDRAKHIASLFMVDLSDFIAYMTTAKFGLIKYGEQLTLSAKVFDYIRKDLEAEPVNQIDKLMLDLLAEKMTAEKPDVVAFTVPFPGTLYSTLKCGQYIKAHFPDTRIVIGGGYISTELRSMTDGSIFDYVDYIVYDDGELPILRLLELFEGKGDASKLVRTTYRKAGAIAEMINIGENINFTDLPTPTYAGIDFTKYISIIEFTNPMHKLWSDGKWLKLTFAHGCYWGKCAFCDTSLDYIKRYESATVDQVIAKIEQMIKETSITGFHFTDEALPPRLLIQFAEKIIQKGLIISFWGNIRFDKTFSHKDCSTLAQAGCVAVAGGFEVVSPRVLKLINKGVSIESGAEVAYNFTSNGIMVHAYLMYGFPTQTMQECIDSVEVVRQMFELGIIQSAFWHRFALTVHSPVGVNPQAFGVNYDNASNKFANNAVEYTETSDINYKRVDQALRSSLYNYMQGMGYDIPLKNWFEDKLAIPTVRKNFIQKILERLQ